MQQDSQICVLAIKTQCGWVDGKTKGQLDVWMSAIYIDRQIDRKIDRWIDKWLDKLIDRYINKYKDGKQIYSGI